MINREDIESRILYYLEMKIPKDEVILNCFINYTRFYKESNGKWEVNKDIFTTTGNIDSLLALEKELDSVYGIFSNADKRKDYIIKRSAMSKDKQNSTKISDLCEVTEKLITVLNEFYLALKMHQRSEEEKIKKFDPYHDKLK